MQTTGDAATLTVLSVKNRLKAEGFECVPGLDRCLAEYKDRWFLIKNLTPDDIAEACWLVRKANSVAVELNNKNQKAAEQVAVKNAGGKMVMVAGDAPKLKPGTQLARVIPVDYASLESEFRRVVIQQKWQCGKQKRQREEDKAGTIRAFLRGMWHVFSGKQADAKQQNRVDNERHWKSQLGDVGVKNFMWCRLAFQASLTHTVAVMTAYRALHPHIGFDSREEKIAMFKSLEWLVPGMSDASALAVAVEGREV